jgi:hypothetical protein
MLKKFIMERNMYEKINLLKCMSAILFFFILGLASISAAGDCGNCNPPPTSAGNAYRCDENKPTIISSSGTVSPGGSITLWVNSGGLANAPYSWSTSNGKYTLNKNSTNGDLETVTLTAASGSCGSVYNNSNIVCTVTVVDHCGNQSTLKIRNSNGHWGTAIVDCSIGGGGTTRYDNIDGDTLYTLYIYFANATPAGSCGGEAPGYNWCYDMDSAPVGNSWLDAPGYNGCYPGTFCAKPSYSSDYCFRFNPAGTKRVDVVWAQHSPWVCN